MKRAATSFSLTCALALSSCATDAYWTQVREPMPANYVQLFEGGIDGKPLLGRSDLARETVLLRNGMGWNCVKCTMGHELKHFAGFDHSDSPAFMIDCGDGTMMVCQ